MFYFSKHETLSRQSRDDHEVITRQEKYTIIKILTNITNMKKGIFTLLLAIVATSVMAVELPKQGFGFHIGYAQPTLRLNSSSNSLEKKDSLVNTTMLHGFKVGVVYDGSFVAGFGCSMGINYTFAANKNDWKTIDVSHSSRNSVLYHELELFVDWQYKFEVAKETYLMIYTGPSMQCGLAYNATTYTRDEWYETVTSDTYNRYGKDRPDEDLKRLNVTWGVGAGFQYQRYFLRGGYDFGLMNPYKAEQFEAINPEGRNLYTRGRFDQWSVKIGMYIWYK